MAIKVNNLHELHEITTSVHTNFKQNNDNVMTTVQYLKIISK